MLQEMNVICRSAKSMIPKPLGPLTRCFAITHFQHIKHFSTNCSDKDGISLLLVFRWRDTRNYQYMSTKVGWCCYRFWHHVEKLKGCPRSLNIVYESEVFVIGKYSSKFSALWKPILGSSFGDVGVRHVSTIHKEIKGKFQEINKAGKML